LKLVRSFTLALRLRVRAGQKLKATYNYETDIHTQHGERTLVLFEHPEKGKGKFVTKSEEMLSALDYIKAQDGFPFRTTITRVEIGHGKWKYTFN
jgi:hypothetical protein